MDRRIADTFTDNLVPLTGDEQKAGKTTTFDLQLNPLVSGTARAAPIGPCPALYPVPSGSYHNAIPSLWNHHGANVRPFHLRAG